MSYCNRTGASSQLNFFQTKAAEILLYIFALLSVKGWKFVRTKIDIKLAEFDHLQFVSTFTKVTKGSHRFLSCSSILF